MNRSLLSTNDLITELRDQAGVLSPGTERNLLEEAADRLEELDEWVAIMSEPYLKEQKNACSDCQEFSCDGCQYAKRI